MNELFLQAGFDARDLARKSGCEKIGAARIAAPDVDLAEVEDFGMHLGLQARLDPGAEHAKDPVAAAIGAVMGTLVAWVLVRDNFPGKRLINSVIDLPFALPTIVAGLTLIALYGPRSPFGIHLAFTRGADRLCLTRSAAKSSARCRSGVGISTRPASQNSS